MNECSICMSPCDTLMRSGVPTILADLSDAAQEHVMAGKEGAASAADYQEKFDELARKAEEDPQRLTLATQTIVRFCGA